MTPAACSISGTGHCRPGAPVPLSDFPDARGGDLPRHRHHAGPGDGSIAMGVRAATEALESAQLKATDLDAAIVFSGMPDYEYPKDGNAILHRLGARNASCWNLDTACASFISGLDAARLRIAGGSARHVLVLMIMNWVGRGIDRTADYSTTGDGAAAVIVSASDSGANADRGFCGVRESTHGEHFGYLELPSPFAGSASGGPSDEQSDTNAKQQAQVELPHFRFGSDPAHGKFLMSACLEPARQLLRETDTTPESVDWFLAHQPGTRLPRIWAKSLGIAPERLLSTYGECGNMSAVNIPMTLHRYATASADSSQPNGDAPRLKRGDRLLFFAPGAGLHVSAMLWVW